MLKLNKQILERLHKEDLRKKYPTFPDYAMPPAKYTDKTANGLTKCIKDFLNHTGHQAERISSGGRQVDNRKVVTDVIGRTRQIGSTKYIPGTSTNGTADISSVIYGASVKIEVKIGKDKQSDDQIKYQQDIEKAGGIYIIAKDFDGFIEWYRSFISKMNIYRSSSGIEFIVFSFTDRKVQRLDNFEVIQLTQQQFKPYEK